MELNLRSRSYGGWWNRGLGEETVLIDSGSGIPYTPTSIDPSMFPEVGSAYGSELDPNDPILQGPGSGSDTGSTTLNYPGMPTGPANQTPYGPPVVTATQIANAIAAAAKIGIQAVAPNAMTGACPAGYVRNGAACVPAAQATQASSGSIIPGMSNQTLLLIGGGFLFLMLLSQGGGKRR